MNPSAEYNLAAFKIGGHKIRLLFRTRSFLRKGATSMERLTKRNVGGSGTAATVSTAESTLGPGAALELYVPGVVKVSVGKRNADPTLLNALN